MSMNVYTTRKKRFLSEIPAHWRPQNRRPVSKEWSRLQVEIPRIKLHKSWQRENEESENEDEVKASRFIKKAIHFIYISVRALSRFYFLCRPIVVIRYVTTSLASAFSAPEFSQTKRVPNIFAGSYRKRTIGGSRLRGRTRRSIVQCKRRSRYADTYIASRGVRYMDFGPRLKEKVGKISDRYKSRTKPAHRLKNWSSLESNRVHDTNELIWNYEGMHTPRTIAELLVISLLWKLRYVDQTLWPSQQEVVEPGRQAVHLFVRLDIEHKSHKWWGSAK